MPYFYNKSRLEFQNKNNEVVIFILMKISLNMKAT